jgi:hypothetical protein
MNAAKRILPDNSQSSLERSFIHEYLHSKGYLWSDLGKLPKQEASSLMKKACIYAALKLSEIEARSRFVCNVKGSD